ncbi:MAG: hypothetical protein ACLTF5_07990 [Butyricicoccus sp.]
MGQCCNDGHRIRRNRFAERWSELAQGKVNTVGESIVINSEKHLWVRMV